MPLSSEVPANLKSQESRKYVNTNSLLVAATLSANFFKGPFFSVSFDRPTQNVEVLLMVITTKSVSLQGCPQRNVLKFVQWFEFSL